MKRMIAVAAFLPGVFLAGTAAADVREGGYWAWGFGHMLFGGFSMVVFLVLVIALIVLAVRWLSGPGAAPPPSRRRALDILEERYARGEIDREEFNAKRDDLTG
jgi:putative membrane protein